MKSTKFSFFLILFLISFLGIDEIKSQHFKCGTPPPTESQRADIMRKLRSNINSRQVSNCFDAVNSETKTYKLIIEYSADEEGETGLSTANIDEIVNHLNTVYNAQNIFFDYYYFPVLCPDCQYNDPGWGRDHPIINTIDFQNCLWARITNEPAGNIVGQGNFTYGRFWAYYPSDQDLLDLSLNIPNSNFISHELGHALGLLHTFNDFKPYIPNNELINQTIDGQCVCNCKFTGDLICDTPVDPFFPGTWNTAMFITNGALTTGIENLNDEVDDCGTSYDQLIPKSNDVLNNVMSYHQTGNISIITSGQASYIKSFNAGKPWEINGLSGSGGTMNSGFVVNGPMTISSPLNLTGNIEIKSKLTVKNTSITFLVGKGIVIKSGGELILDNGHLGLYGGMECVPAATFWNGISSNGPGIVKFSAKNGSTVNNAKIALNIRNATFLANISDSRINSYYDTALEIIDGKGQVKINNSYINGVVTVENFFSGLDISRSFVNTPALLDPKTGAIKRLYCKNAMLQIKNNCSINTQVNVNNTGSQTVRLSNSSFSEPVELSTQAVTVIRENFFNSKYSFNGTTPFGLNVLSNRRIDLYGNVFYTSNGAKFGSSNESSPLIFKNKFTVSDIGYQNDQSGSLADIFCNEFVSGADINIELNKKVRENQGLPTIAAGNLFPQNMSAFNIRYFDVPRLDYFYRNVTGEGPFSTFGNVTKIELLRVPSTCSLKYPITPSTPVHCSNGIKDGDEKDVDCGGSCPPCVPVIIQAAQCTNGVQDIGETGIDCGGPCPPCLASCTNGIQDNGETGLDCGGPCPPCSNGTPATCNDGVLNGNETGVDCGGPICPPCNITYCNNGIQDNGETGIDCGGPCPPCGMPHCSNGIQDANETGIDCGGSCPPCVVIYPPTCFNGIQDGNETGIDCGGSCPPCVVVYPPHCYNSVKDGNESGIDCGGSCPPCGYFPPIGGGYGDGGSAGKYVKGNHSPFIESIDAIFGTGFMTLDKYKVTQDFMDHYLTLDGGNTCALQQHIRTQSPLNQNNVLQNLASLSPNVSPNTIHVLFENSRYYTSSQVAQIIKLNPAILKDRYISQIVYATNSFSPNDKNEIINNASNNDSRSQIENIINFKKQCQEAIIRDNIAMISLNDPFDFNAVRSELATDASIYKVFDIAQSYADQGRFDLAIESLSQVNSCYFTDPLIKAQTQGLIILYQNWNALPIASNRNKDVINEINKILTEEHGFATDMAASIASKDVSITERWKYQPLSFKTASGNNDVVNDKIKIYPNPVTSILNIEIPNGQETKSLRASIYNSIGQLMTEIPLESSTNIIDISEYLSGVYTVKILNETQLVLVQKFIKLK